MDELNPTVREQEIYEEMELTPEMVKSIRTLGDRTYLDYALAHQEAIARFGRFPHRNPVLGRASTAAEIRAVEAGHSW